MASADAQLAQYIDTFWGYGGLIVIARHPNSFGVTNAYFEQIGRTLTGDHRTM